jgi:hypothetical protein
MNISCILNKKCVTTNEQISLISLFDNSSREDSYSSLLLKLLKVDEIKDSSIPKMNAHKNPSM